MKPKNNILNLQTALGYALNTTGLIKQSIALNAKLDILQPYATLADDLLVLNYPDFKIKSYINEGNATLFTCNALRSEYYNFKTLIGTLDLEYNPIENYNMIEEGTDNRTLDYAEKTVNSELQSAEKQTTLDMNSVQKSSTDTTTHSVAPFNNTTMTATEQDTTQHTQQPFKDTNTTTQTPFTDKSEQTESAHIDTDNLTHKLTRSGNIGVTTSQQMIESERALANINIPALICEIVVKNICKGVQLTL